MLLLVLAVVGSPSIGTAAARPAGLTDTEPSQALAAVAPTRRTARATAAPNLTATVAFAVDLTAGAELYAQNADLPVPPASTAKVVTALVVMDMVTRGRAALDEPLRVEQDDEVDIAIYSHVGLEAGDLVTVHDLLAGMLIPSGGDAARTLARAMGQRLPGAPSGDPRQRFASAMNATAARLGMRHSHFINPGDDDQPGQVSTARDLAIAGAALFSYPVLERIVAMPAITLTVGGPNARLITLESTNELLGEPGVHGLKTGRSDDAGECLILTTWRGGDRVLTVVLGSVERFDDTRVLLDYLDQRFAWVRLGQGGDLPGLDDELTRQGLHLMTGRTLLIRRADLGNLRFTLTGNSTGGQRPWQARGEVEFAVGSRQVLRLPVYGPSTPDPRG